MSFRNEIRYCPKQDFCYEGIKTLSLFKLFLLLPDVLIGLSSYFLHSRKKKKYKIFFFSFPIYCIFFTILVFSYSILKYLFSGLCF